MDNKTLRDSKDGRTTPLYLISVYYDYLRLLIGQGKNFYKKKSKNIQKNLDFLYLK